MSEPRAAGQTDLAAKNTAYDAVRFERRRIARELHDRVAQEQIVAILQMRKAMIERSTSAPALAHALSAAQQALSATRQLIADLRTANWSDSATRKRIQLRGPVSALLRRTTANTAIAAHSSIEEGIYLPTRICEDVEMILHEAILNALKHSGASMLVCCAHLDADEVVIEVIDNGVGFDLTTGVDGFGLLGIAERAQAIGATLELRTCPGSGTTLRLHLLPS